jgi:MinD-like ATPase involved in chromosome partitioning or flagellar assembly
MSYYSFVGAKGCNGVTTTCLALLAAGLKLGEEIIMVEYDRAGCELAIKLGESSNPGLATLLASLGSTGKVSDIRQHCQYSSSGLPVVFGMSSLESFDAVLDMTEKLALFFQQASETLLIDLGRFGGVNLGTEHIFSNSEAVIIVARPNPVGISFLRACVTNFRKYEIDPVVLLIGDKPYRSNEIQTALSVKVLGTLPIDVKTAQDLNYNGKIKFNSSLLRAASEIFGKLGDLYVKSKLPKAESKHLKPQSNGNTYYLEHPSFGLSRLEKEILNKSAILSTKEPHD